jgi:hypothetical protein
MLGRVRGHSPRNRFKQRKWTVCDLIFREKEIDNCRDYGQPCGCGGNPIYSTTFAHNVILLFIGSNTHENATTLEGLSR